MADCIFQDVVKGTRCDYCGWRLPMDYAGDPPHRRCPLRVPTCIYFGDLVREVVSNRGRGCTRRRGVYACERRGECVPFRPELTGIACCEACSLFTADTSAEAELS